MKRLDVLFVILVLLLAVSLILVLLIPVQWVGKVGAISIGLMGMAVVWWLIGSNDEG